jgi:hypothetical protein
MMKNTNDKTFILLNSTPEWQVAAYGIHRHIPKLSTLLRHQLTYLLHGAVLLEKPTVFQLVTKFPAFYKTRRFITAITSARHLSLSWANSVQSPQPLPTSWRSFLIVSSHLRLGLPSGLFHSGFPTRTLCTPLSSPIRATCSTHLILLYFTTRIITLQHFVTIRCSIIVYSLL